MSIRTTILGREQTRVVAVSALERLRPPRDSSINYVGSLPSEEKLKEKLRPVSPQRELDEMMDAQARALD